jgi:nitrate/TMAO reductase-like tetraheme cytochrome c subunit
VGDELGPLFLDRPQTHLLWIVGLLAAVPALLIAGYTLFRGQISREFGFAGLVVVPMVVLLVANLVILNRSKEVQFCGSCHEPMAPLVKSLTAKDGSLASIHYRSGAVKDETACYTCHSGYGLVGDIAAKVAGHGHMWHELSGAYEYPLKMRGPFDIDSCLDCHRSAEKFKAVPSHKDVKIQGRLMSRELSCTGTCHPRAHPDEALVGVGGGR